MPEFVFDTSGRVQIDGAPFQGATIAWNYLDSFTQGYIEAMFFTDEEQLCEESGREMPAVAFNTATMESRFVGGDSPGFGDLSPAALARIMADCAKFQDDNRALMDEAAGRDYAADSAGRDFWYTRNGHGCGFWDRQELESDSGEYEALTSIMVANVGSPVWDEALAKRNALESQSPGERLSAAAQSFPSVDTYVGDDGLIYLA